MLLSINEEYSHTQAHLIKPGYNLFANAVSTHDFLTLFVEVIDLPAKFRISFAQLYNFFVLWISRCPYDHALGPCRLGMLQT